MDFTTIRQLAHMEAVGLLLLALLTYPILRHMYLRLDRLPGWPLYAACVLGIVWFAGLLVSTGQESRIVSRAVLVPFLAITELGAVNFAVLWYGLLLRRHVQIERRAKGAEMQATGTD